MSIPITPEEHLKIDEIVALVRQGASVVEACRKVDWWYDRFLAFSKVHFGKSARQWIDAVLASGKHWAMIGNGKSCRKTLSAADCRAIFGVSPGPLYIYPKVKPSEAPPNAHAVVCTTTGRRYHSVSLAAKEFKCPVGLMSRAAKTRKPFLGHSFAYADQL
jgi:hypothetical protein